MYNHVASQSMPLSTPFFSDEACEAVRLWYNLGCPKDKSEIGHTTLPLQEIPVGTPEKPFYVRKDINTLTALELTTYRTQLLKVGAGDLNSTW